ncbi:ABC transporter substrate-binding protein [Streptomyces sp. NPDC015414]|uniref:ABC transporter substrate-binding protein n=1 Tax=Streptomyces sp. NPDC015414 TaxID=3364957 RepID=UPI0036F6EB5B
MTTRRSFLAAAAASLMLSTACGAGTGSGSGSADLEFLTGTAVDSPLYKEYQRVVKAYEQKHPGTKVNLRPAGTNYEGDVKVRLASGNLPDIWMTHGWSLLRYSSFLAPLQHETWAKDLNPALKPAMVGSGGDLYALPVDTDIAGLLYNKDVLARAGVDPASLRTWKDFDQAAQKMKQKGTVPIYGAGKDRWPTGLYVDWLAPGMIDQGDLDAMKKGTFAETGYTQVLKEVEKWHRQGLFNPDYSSATTDNVARALADGKTGFSFLMNFVATSAFEYKPDAKVGFLPIPSPDGRPYLISGEKNALGINKKSPHLAQAKELLAFMARPVNLTALAKASGSAPGLTTATPDLGGLTESYKEYVAPGKVPTRPYFDRVCLPNGAWDTVVSSTDGVVTGQSSVSSAVQTMKKQYTALRAQSH